MDESKNDFEESTVGVEGGRSSCSGDEREDRPVLGENEPAAAGQKPVFVRDTGPQAFIGPVVPGSHVASRRHAIHPPAGISSCLSQGFGFTGGGRKHEPSEEDAEQRKGRCHQVAHWNIGNARHAG